MNITLAILKTLAYHDIFDYPLTQAELYNYLIDAKTTPRILSKNLGSIKDVESRANYYCLKGRDKIIKLRKSREAISKRKFKKAQHFARILSLIPYVKFVGLTGALAMENSSESDDIDLLIISAKNSLWTTRFLTNLSLFPYKRSPKSQKQKNKACLNIFIEEAHLTISEQNIYTAHEISQIIPLYNKGKTYHKFIDANNWLYKHLPNWQPKVISCKQNNSNAVLSASSLESLLMRLQLGYMKSKITSEKIGTYQLFFHPKATEDRILKIFKTRLKSLSVDEESQEV